jgi:hypothetical protein
MVFLTNNTKKKAPEEGPKSSRFLTKSPSGAIRLPKARGRRPSHRPYSLISGPVYRYFGRTIGSPLPPRASVRSHTICDAMPTQRDRPKSTV